MVKYIPYCIIILIGFAAYNNCFALPAFPGAEGYGSESIGGRGGIILEVTNLNDSGPGSLRQAVEFDEPRIVIFRVSGTIELQSRLKISHPYITIAGQTAPGDGICLKDHGFQISADHVIVRYIRSRLGDNHEAEDDSISVTGGRNIILDHCSASWSVDETLSVTTDSDDLGGVTIQWCIISESLNCSVHSKGCHGYGSLVRGCFGNGYSFHHNLYAHHRGRSPRPGNYNSYNIDPNGMMFDFRNNVVYNWSGSYAGYNADTDSITQMNFVGNYYKEGPDSSSSCVAFREQCVFSTAYFYDNYMNGICPRDPWSLVRFDGFSTDLKNQYKQTLPIPTDFVQTDDATAAYERVIADAGDNFPIRDEVDERVINDVVNGTGQIINDESEVGGWPVLESAAAPVDTDHDGMPDDWELAHDLNPLDLYDANDDRTDDGYTNIEEYINQLPLITAQ